MSGSGKGLLGLWLYRSGESEWALKEGSPLHKKKDLVVNIKHYNRMFFFYENLLQYTFIYMQPTK